MNLNRHVRENPFNNFSKLFLATGHTPPVELGGNCVWHAHKLTEELPKQGYSNIRYPLDQQGKHVAVLANRGDETLLFDPVMMHWEPINLSEAIEYEQNLTLGYPIIRNTPAVIKTKFLPEGILVEKLAFEFGTIPYKDFFYTTILDSIQPINDLQTALAVRSNLFYIICIDSEGVQRTLTYRSNKMSFRDQYFGGESSGMVLCEGDESKTNLSIIESTVGISIETIKQYMIEAGEILTDLRTRAACVA